MLDAGRDDEVEVTCLDRGGAVERRLQRGAALTIHGRRAHGLRPAGDEYRSPPDVQGLLSDLRDAAHLHVLDLTRVEVDSTDQAVQDLRGELVGADVGE